MTDTLTVFSALRSEARAVRSTLPGARVIRTGMGPDRARRSARSRKAGGSGPVAVAGFAGAVAELAVGDVVVASEVRGPDGGSVPLPGAGLLVAGLRRRGLTVHVGPITTVGRIVLGARRRAAVAATGALAVDMESAPIVAALRAAGRGGDGGTGADRPLAVVRVIVDAPGRPLVSPGVVRSGIAARRVLTQVAAAIGEWAAAAGPRSVVLAGPRSFCAGVERAIDIVEKALVQRGAPVYVRRQIVHNAHVVADLEQRGAVFVDEVDQVPEGATVVFSAHGVAPSVWTDATVRNLQVIDATCPLVAKVHAEARRFVGRGDTVVLIGHAGHEEVEGTLGEAPGEIRLVESIADAETLTIPDPDRVSYLMQTTLAVDEAGEIADALRERWPGLRNPSSDDICYATTNRQDAVRAIAADTDLVLVIGSTNSSNSQRLAEIARRAGRPAHLIDDDTMIDPSWLVGVDRIGVTAGASAPPALVDRVVASLAGLGPVTTVERTVATESVSFHLPKEVS